MENSERYDKFKNKIIELTILPGGISVMLTYPDKQKGSTDPGTISLTMTIEE